MIDAQGRVAAHTGASTIAEAGHLIGDGFSAQANMMLRAKLAERREREIVGYTERDVDAMNPLA
jgi:uncharacterized Ntn-hydrolase superfamily protein